MEVVIRNLWLKVALLLRLRRPRIQRRVLVWWHGIIVSEKVSSISQSFPWVVMDLFILALVIYRFFPAQ
jgi:hypothetical protein